MARTPADRTTQTSVRDQLAELGTFAAHTKRPDLAAAVDEVLAPGGWEKLRATDPSRVEGSDNLAINIPESLRDQIWQAAEADPAGTTLTAKAIEGLGEYLAGRFTMPEWVDQRPVQPEKRVNLNVRVPRLLITQASTKVREESGDRRASAARVAAEYLMSVYELGRYAPGSRKRLVLARGAQRNPEVPRRIRDQIREMATACGERVDDIVNEGFQKFLDGVFIPERVVWRPEDMADMVPLRMHPNDELFDLVKEACKQMKQGGRAHPVLNAKTGPRTVAIAYLLDEFDLAGEAGTE